MDDEGSEYSARQPSDDERDGLMQSQPQEDLPQPPDHERMDEVERIGGIAHPRQCAPS